MMNNCVLILLEQLATLMVQFFITIFLNKLLDSSNCIPLRAG